MVRKSGRKDFTSGLDALIQKTTAGSGDRDLQDYQDLQEVKDAKESKEPKAAKEKERQITITIPASLKLSIKKYCAAHEIKIKDLIINSVSIYMKSVRDLQD